MYLESMYLTALQIQLHKRPKHDSLNRNASTLVALSDLKFFTKLKDRFPENTLYKTTTDKGGRIEELMIIMFVWPSVSRKSTVQDCASTAFKGFVYYQYMEGNKIEHNEADEFDRKTEIDKRNRKNAIHA